jgi:hypothetical protein
MSNPIRFDCDYDPRRGVFSLTVAGRHFTMTEAVFDTARRLLKAGAYADTVPRSLSLDLGGFPLNLVGAARTDLVSLSGIFEAAATASARHQHAAAN